MHNRIDLSVGWSIRSGPFGVVFCHRLAGLFFPLVFCGRESIGIRRGQRSGILGITTVSGGEPRGTTTATNTSTKTATATRSEASSGKNRVCAERKKKKEKKKNRIRGTVVFVVECLLPPGRRNAVGGRKRTRDSFLMTLRGWVARTAHDQRHRDRRFGVSEYGSRTTRHDTTRHATKNTETGDRGFGITCALLLLLLLLLLFTRNEATRARTTENTRLRIDELVVLLRCEPRGSSVSCSRARN